MYTYVRTYIHSYIHTYIRTYIHGSGAFTEVARSVPSGLGGAPHTRSSSNASNANPRSESFLQERKCYV